MFRTGRPNGNLEAALVQLLQNQAIFVSHLDEDRQRFARIERDLDLIKAMLVKHREMLEKLPEAIRMLSKHQEMLEKLPEAIRDKIGFKQ